MISIFYNPNEVISQSDSQQRVIDWHNRKAHGLNQTHLQNFRKVESPVPVTIHPQLLDES